MGVYIKGINKWTAMKILAGDYPDYLDKITEIDLVRCGECKYYDTESRTFPCCTDIFGAVRYMEADGFCSKGERRTDEHIDKRD